MQNIILRSEAKSLKLKRYFTGKPCKRSHISERNTSDGSCLICKRENEANNRDDINARKRELYKSNPESFKKRSEKWTANNKDKVLNRTRKWKLNNKEKVKFQAKECHKRRVERGVSYYRENKEKVQKRIKENFKYRLFISKKYKLSKLNATPQWADLDKIKTIYAECHDGYHVDHIVPINSKLVCGLHCEFNLQYLSALENIVKGNRYWPDMP